MDAQGLVVVGSERTNLELQGRTDFAYFDFLWRKYVTFRFFVFKYVLENADALIRENERPEKHDKLRMCYGGDR